MHSRSMPPFYAALDFFRVISVQSVLLFFLIWPLRFPSLFFPFVVSWCLEDVCRQLNSYRSQWAPKELTLTVSCCRKGQKGEEINPPLLSLLWMNCTFAVEKCRRLIGYVGILHDMWLVNNEHTGLTTPNGLLSFSLHHFTQCLPIRRYVVVHCHRSVCSLLSSAVPRRGNKSMR